LRYAVGYFLVCLNVMTETGACPQNGSCRWLAVLTLREVRRLPAALRTKGLFLRRCWRRDRSLPPAARWTTPSIGVTSLVTVVDQAPVTLPRYETWWASHRTAGTPDRSARCNDVVHEFCARVTLVTLHAGSASWPMYRSELLQC